MLPGLRIGINTPLQTLETNGNGNVVAARAEGNGNGNNGNQQASTLGTQTDKAPVYDSGGSAKVHHYDNCYSNDIFNMFTQEEKYTELLDPITEPHAVQHNNINVISVDSSVEHSGGTLSKEKSTVSLLQEEKKKFKSDFKTREDELLDKQIQLEKKIKELDNILVKMGQSIQTIHILSPKADSFYHTNQKMALAVKGMSVNTKFKKPSILGKPPSSSGTKLYSVTPFLETLINPLKNYREDKYVSNIQVKASFKTKPITVSQPHVITKKDVNSYSNGLPSTRVDSTAKTRRPQPRSNTKNDRVTFASKSSCVKNKDVEVEEHHRNLLLSKNKKHMSSECNNIKLAIRNDKYVVVYAMCKQCLITTNHDVCVLNYATGMSSCNDNQSANVSNSANYKKYMPNVKKPKKSGSKARLASPKPSKSRTCLRWSPTRRIFYHCGKIIKSNDSECYPNLFMFMGTVRFRNDHVAAILGYGDLQWGNILIARVYYVKGLRHNLFSVGQYFDSDLEVAFRRNTCFVRNLEGVDLLKGNQTTNLYTINLLEMASASPICLMDHATSTKSWLWHQRLSHLNFDTINNLAKNDLVTGLLKFKYHKEYLYPSCEQGKSKNAPHQPKPVPNSKQRLHLLYMDLYGPMRVESINGKRVLCYPKNDREDIGKLGTKGDIDFFIGYSANSCAYSVYNRRTKKIMEMMNVTFDELLAKEFEQHSSKPGLQGMTYGQIIAPRPDPATSPAQDVDELQQIKHVQQQDAQAQLQPEAVTDNVPNAMFNENTFVNPFAPPSTSSDESSS
ncbi:retrovirus-related pol polyprotein from transposon TNT 1-94 [Tanacetum coccineum]